MAFQRLRKDEKLIVQFQKEIRETDLQIAPLMLVVLIENAFKFVRDFADRENKISISICTKGHVLQSSFVNTKELQPASMPPNANGIGIANFKRRLELLYPGKYEPIVNSENDLS